MQSSFGGFVCFSPSPCSRKTVLPHLFIWLFTSHRILSVTPVTSNVNKWNSESHTGTISPPKTGGEASYDFKCVGTNVWFLYISIWQPPPPLPHRHLLSLLCLYSCLPSRCLQRIYDRRWRARPPLSPFCTRCPFLSCTFDFSYRFFLSPLVTVKDDLDFGCRSFLSPHCTNVFFFVCVLHWHRPICFLL